MTLESWPEWAQAVLFVLGVVGAFAYMEFGMWLGGRGAVTREFIETPREEM